MMDLKINRDLNESVKKMSMEYLLVNGVRRFIKLAIIFVQFAIKK